jgi:hypothetical protein
VHEAVVVVGGPVLPRVLSQVTHGASTHDRPRERLGLAGQDAEQRRLAGAVAAHDADLVACSDREREPLQDRPAGDLDGERTDVEDVHGDPRVAGGRAETGEGRWGYGS